MNKLWNAATSIVMAAALLISPVAHAASDPQNLVDRARITVDDLSRDPEFGNAPQLMARAKGVMIVPSLIKGGFFFGGEGGDAVLLARTGDKSWSEPAFYTMASASFGLQIGMQQSELILFVLSSRGLKALMQNKFKIGAQAGIAVVTLGSSAQAATTTNGGADIVVWASSTGAYAGLTLEGTIIKPRNSFNESYYGRPVSVRHIVVKPEVLNRGADGLRIALAKLS